MHEQSLGSYDPRLNQMLEALQLIASNLEKVVDRLEKIEEKIEKLKGSK